MNKEKIFSPYLQFYWKFIAICAVLLLITALMKGSIEQGTITITLNDPIVILLFFFIVFASASFLYALFKARTIIIGEDYFILKSKFGEKKINSQDIESIRLGRERLFQFKEKLRIIKIKLKNKRRLIRIRPSSFEEDQELSDSILQLKKKLPKN